MSESKDIQSYLDILREQDSDEAKRYSRFHKYLEKKARVMNVPFGGQFELTPLCNLNCAMCYVHLTKEQMGDTPLLTVNQWKDIMYQAFSAGMFEAALTGGECLTYPGFDELFLFLQDLGCQVSLLTNGVLLDDARIEFFKNHPPALIQVTLYGNSEDVYERVTGNRVFGKVTQNLQQVKETGLPLMVSVTPSQALGEDVFETIRLAYSITNAVLVGSSLFVPEGEDWRKVYEEKPDVEFYTRIRRFQKELRGETLQYIPLEDLPEPGGNCCVREDCGLLCGGGRSGFVIDWKGNMRICSMMNIKAPVPQGGFPAAWEYINSTAVTWLRVAECIGCPYEKVCDICPGNFQQYAEPGKQPKEYCQQVRYMVSRGVLPASQCEL